MRSIVFDTETTGFQPGSICQLSYIITDHSIVEQGGDDAAFAAKNIFFQVPYVEPGAQNVHGFSVERLKELSGGCEFGVFADEICADFESCALWIAHNFDFDRRFLTAEFRKINKPLRVADSFCTMKYFTPLCKLPQPNLQRAALNPYKYPNLQELTVFLGVSAGEIAAFAQTVFGLSEPLQSHDARYDSAAACLCYQKASAGGMIRSN